MKNDAKVIQLEPGAETDTAITERSDDELMLLARGGRHQAFDVLVRRHQRRVLGIAFKQLGDQARAKDVAQESFLEVYRYLPRYQPKGLFKAFLHRILINQCRMVQRSAGADRRRIDALLAAPQAAPSDLSEERILARERRRDVERALRGLSDKLREVVVLRYAGEMPLQEIADTLEVPIGTVKSRLFAGVEKLRSMAQEEP